MLPRVPWKIAALAHLSLLCAVGQAQAFLAPRRDYSTSHIAKPVSTHNGGKSWLWVHSGTVFQISGSFADWATSWKQPEGNSSLTESSGTYQGRFYRTAVARRAAFSAGLAAASYAIGWKWPKARRLVGVFNMTVGSGFAAAAISNAIRNPYYKP
jgi:hypothetical protein